MCLLDLKISSAKSQRNTRTSGNLLPIHIRYIGPYFFAYSIVRLKRSVKTKIRFYLSSSNFAIQTSSTFSFSSYVGQDCTQDWVYGRTRHSVENPLKLDCIFVLFKIRQKNCYQRHRKNKNQNQIHLRRFLSTTLRDRSVPTTEAKLVFVFILSKLANTNRDKHISRIEIVCIRKTCKQMIKNVNK